MSIRQGRPEDLLQRPVSHCLRCCSLPCIQSPPSSSVAPFPFTVARRLLVEVKLDKWMLTLNINCLLSLIINLISDFLSKLFTYATLLSRLHLSSLRLSRKLCNAFYLFTKANTHLPRRHGERSVAFRVRQSHCTRVHSQPLYPRPPREKEKERREREE